MKYKYIIEKNCKAIKGYESRKRAIKFYNELLAKSDPDNDSIVFYSADGSIFEDNKPITE